MTGLRSTHVLLVEDNAEILAHVRRGLQRRGYDVSGYGDGTSALRACAQEQPDIVILDLLLPDMDGIDLCYQLREMDGPPIIMLTSLDSVSDRVEGLRAGADDYIVKPFAMEELAARIEAVLRRKPPEAQQVVFEDLRIDTDARTVTRGDAIVPVTSKEFHLLELLARRANRVVTRQVIMSTLWPLEERVDDNVLDAHSANLRQTLEAGGGRRLIQTVRGFGYVLR